MYLVSLSGNPQAADELVKGSPEGDEIDSGLSFKWQTALEQGEDDAKETDIPLPVAFRSATYRQTDKGAFIDLSFGKQLPKAWCVFISKKDNEVLLDEKRWKENESSETVAIPWLKSQPPSGFEVSWGNGIGSAWWPVNVDKPSSLPAPEVLKDLPLDVLIEILTSARPLYQAMKNWLRRKENAGKQMESPLIDPHKRVDTSAFIIQKTRRVSWAFNGLKEKLERPVASEDALEWRINGPVGIQAIKKAIIREAKSEEEKSFLLTELSLELSRIKPRTAPAHLSVTKVKKEIGKVIEELQYEVKQNLNSVPPTMRKYILACFEEANS